MNFEGMTMEQIMRTLDMERRLARMDSKGSFARYLTYSSPDYQAEWFHRHIANKCQSLFEGTLGKDRLMLFVPPQHGKSEIVSRKFPSWALGKNPRIKIVGASYSATLAQQFSRAIQRTMDTKEYLDVFPETRLNGSNVVTTKGWLRTADIFEIVDYGGFYKAVGVGGSLTGTPVDIGIIDDPIKDAMEANSSIYRERVWEWYTSVFLTRLHNDSKQLIIMTRWHDDDLAGRLLKHEGDKWEVVSIPAIKEDDSNPDDPRREGEALWESKHSLESLREIENRSPRTFASLYQQRPTIQGGNIVKEAWFRTIGREKFEYLRRNTSRSVIPIVFFIDTAYTDKTSNDPTGIIGACKIGEDLYISCAEKVNLKFPDLVRFIPDYVARNGYTTGSSVRIEPKANGISVIDQLKVQTHLNVTRTPTPTDSKETRLNAKSVHVECGRVYLVEGAWVAQFKDEVCGFPSKPHDEYVDLLCYACDHFLDGHKPIDLERLSKIVH